MPAPVTAVARYSQAPPSWPPRSRKASASRPAASAAKPPMISAGCPRLPIRCQLRLTRANASPAGAKVSPARSADSPSPPCRCSASVKKNPPNTARTANIAAMPMAAPGSRSTRPGIRGDRPAAATRRSTTANAAKPTTLAARHTQPQSGQCSDWPSTSGSTRASAAGVRIASPAGSSPRPRPPRPRGRSRLPAISSAAPIGTFSRNTGRHVLPHRSALTSSPPTTWPATAPPASTAAYRRIGRARAGPGKDRWMRLSTWGIMAAAPAPCTNRSVTSTLVEPARPQPSEARVNKATPNRNIVR